MIAFGLPRVVELTPIRNTGTGVGKQSRTGSSKQSPIATRIGVGGTPEPQVVVRRTQRGSD
jgi:hypothetical protein